VKKKKKISGIWFLTAVIVCYIIAFILDSNSALKALKISLNIFYKIIPIIAIVLCFTAAIKFFISPNKISKYLGRESGISGFLIAAVAGLISHGAVYLWYTLLQELHKKGMSKGLMAVFLYNRAVKIPLIPIMIHYFSLKFVILLTFYTIISSFVLGIAIDLLSRDAEAITS